MNRLGITSNVVPSSTKSDIANRRRQIKLYSSQYGHAEFADLPYPFTISELTRFTGYKRESVKKLILRLKNIERVGRRKCEGLYRFKH